MTTPSKAENVPASQCLHGIQFYAIAGRSPEYDLDPFSAACPNANPAFGQFPSEVAFPAHRRA